MYIAVFQAFAQFKNVTMSNYPRSTHLKNQNLIDVLNVLKSLKNKGLYLKNNVKTVLKAKKKAQMKKNSIVHQNTYCYVKTIKKRDYCTLETL